MTSISPAHKRRTPDLFLSIPPSPSKKIKSTHQFQALETKNFYYLQKKRFDNIALATQFPKELTQLTLSFFSYSAVTTPKEKKIFTLLEHTDIVLSRIRVTFLSILPSCCDFSNYVAPPPRLFPPQLFSLFQYEKKPVEVFENTISLIVQQFLEEDFLDCADLQLLQSESQEKSLLISQKEESLQALDVQLSSKHFFTWKQLSSSLETYRILTTNPSFSFSDLKNKIGTKELTFDFSNSEITDAELDLVVTAFKESQVVTLYLNRTPITLISSLSLLTSLRHLELDFCTRLGSIRPLASLKMLEHLSLQSCHVLQIEQIAPLISLKYLDLSNWNTFDNLTALTPLKSLQNLRLNGCLHLSNIDTISSLTSLIHLSLVCCTSITDIRAAASLRFLRSLDLSGCIALDETAFSIQFFRSLQNLNLNGCSQLTDKAQSIAFLSSLVSLDLSGFHFPDINFLGPLKCLKSLTLRSCINLVDISAVTSFRSLIFLDVHDCAKLVNIDSLAYAIFLEDLNLDGCVKITKLNSLADLKYLKNLNLTNLGTLTNEDIIPLTSITSLEGLNLTWCANLTKIDTFFPMTSLRTLKLTNCYQLPDIRPLFKLLPSCEII